MRAACTCWVSSLCIIYVDVARGRDQWSSSIARELMVTSPACTLPLRAANQRAVRCSLYSPSAARAFLPTVPAVLCIIGPSRIHWSRPTATAKMATRVRYLLISRKSKIKETKTHYSRVPEEDQQWLRAQNVGRAFKIASSLSQFSCLLPFAPECHGDYGSAVWFPHDVAALRRWHVSGLIVSAKIA